MKARLVSISRSRIKLKQSLFTLIYPILVFQYHSFSDRENTTRFPTVENLYLTVTENAKKIFVNHLHLLTRTELGLSSSLGKTRDRFLSIITKILNDAEESPKKPRIVREDAQFCRKSIMMRLRTTILT